MLIELSTELLLIIMFGSGILLVTLYKARGKPTKSKQIKANESVLNEHTTVLIEQQRESYVSIIDGLKQQIKSLQGAVNRYKGIYPDEDEDEGQTQTTKISSKNLEENYDIDIQKALPLLETFKSSIPFLKNMDSSKIPSLLNNPIVKNYIWDYIKKNKDQMLQIGVIVPKGTIQQVQEKPAESTEVNTNGVRQLEFSQTNAGYMA